MYRIGTGYDAHRLETGRKLVLGGVEIPHDRGLLGHSDADVLLHAICDAMLGAAALPDIGAQFPPEAPQYKDISSLTLLEQTGMLIAAEGYQIQNIDATVICEAPKIAPHIPAMKERIAENLAISQYLIGIKATTTEGLGFTGRGEGIAAQAAVLLKKREIEKPAAESII